MEEEGSPEKAVEGAKGCKAASSAESDCTRALIRNPHRQLADAVDEGGEEALRRAHDLDCRQTVEVFNCTSARFLPTQRWMPNRMRDASAGAGDR
jgi:hypothetical protein